MPRRLQSKIHSEKSTVAQIWTDYKQQIIDLWNASQSKADFNDHLIREFNRKINRFNKSSDLFITPFDAGFRFTANSTFSSNLVAHWKLDETSGTRYDSVGVANLTPETLGSTQANYIQGIIGNSVNFSNENFLVGAYLLPLTGRAASFSVWIKRSIAGEDGYLDYSLFVLNEYPSFYITDDGRIDIGVSPGGGTEECRVRSQVNINDNEWHHIVGTSDGDLQKMYIDGVLHRTGGDTYTLISDTPEVDMSLTFPDLPYRDIMMNALPPAQDFGTSPCSVDSFSVWNRELSAAEVTKLYNNGQGLDLESFNV
jgi:hypothetical protein